jgi:N,N-dimethylformamidase
MHALMSAAVASAALVAVAPQAFAQSDRLSAAPQATLSAQPLRPVDAPLATSGAGAITPRGRAGDEVTIAAERCDGTMGRFYNGKIAAPLIAARPLTVEELDAWRCGAPPMTTDGVVAAWDFSDGIPTAVVTDRGPHGHHGHAHQRPMRGATGPRWDGTETAWPHAVEQYDAIHFHDDDLDDAGWDADLRWTVPQDVPSGVYALRVEADGVVDHVPFAIRPRRGHATARIALLLPTFSYLAYANEQMITLQGMTEQTGVSDAIADYPSSPEDRYAVGQRLRSLYDAHSDGSGVCYASRLRPLVNMRPTYEMAVLGTPHQFAADLMIVDWLHEQGYTVDVVTDDDLDAGGADVLRPYQVVLSGSHCEYWSRRMLDGMDAYLVDGGRFLYLAGNGMYWVTERDQRDGHTIEVRRRGPGTRTWEPEPGEAHLSTPGELGGLWRYRGRAPQTWAGVGFTAAGGESPGRPFTRTAQSRDPRVAWIFDGVGDQPIGDTPSLIIRHGAAAQEFDRADQRQGAPPEPIVLGSATGL